MHLTSLESLSSATLTSQDTKDVAAINHSVRLTSPLARLRYGGASEDDALQWLQTIFSVALPVELTKPRISSLFADTKKDDLTHELPAEVAAEHIAIRDLDLPQPSPPPARAPASTIVSCASYFFYPSGPPAPSSIVAQPPASAIQAPVGINTALESHWSTLLNTTLHSSFRALPCFCLQFIATLTPSHLRQGTAKKLVEWIFPYADEWNMPVVLAASAMGVKLYENCGFAAVGKCELDLRDWGWRGGEEERVHRHVLMVRWPEKQAELGGEWKRWREKRSLGIWKANANLVG